MLIVMVLCLVMILGMWMFYMMDDWLERQKKQEPYDLEKQIDKVFNKYKKKPKRKKR